MIARATAGHLGFAALLVVFMLAFAPRAAHAQGEPTPFWIGDPPASETPAPAKKKSKPARPAPPVKHKSSSAFQDDDEAPPPPKHKAAPAPKPPPATRPKPAPRASVKKKKASPVEEEEAPLPAPKKKSRYEPLPPLPHLEPAPQGYPPPTQPAPNQPPYQQPYRPPAPTTPQPLPRGSPAQAPRATAPPPYQPPYSTPPQPSVVVPIDERGTATDPSSEKYKQAHPIPPPAPSQTYQPRQYQPLRPDQLTPEVATEEETATPRLRRYSLEALGGVWSKATSDAKTRDWQIAYGLDFGVAVAGWLALDVRAVRSAGTDGNANLNTTTSHLLFDGRLIGVVNLGKFAVFGGAGGGLVLEKTQLFLQDVGSAPTTLSSSGLEGIAEVVVGGRWRPWKGFTVRLEVDGLLRQGALEPVFLLGAGWAF